jgi:hypothetical protein
MAIRYVKDFEFPSACGFTKSATKVTGQMYAKGGDVKKPAGMMVVIGVGKPAKGAVRKAEGDDASNYTDDGYDRAKLAQMAGDAGAVTDAERIMSGRSGQGAITDAEARAMRNAAAKKRVQARRSSPYIPGSNIPVDQIYSKEDMERMERGYKKGGKVAKVMREYKAGELHSGSKKGPKVTNPKQAIAIALSEAGKSKPAMAKGGKWIQEAIKKPGSLRKSLGVKEGEKIPAKKLHAAAEKPGLMGKRARLAETLGKMHKAKGGKVSHMEWEHSKEDLAQDRKLAKKHGMSLEKWEKSALDKKHDEQQSPKGLAAGGVAARPLDLAKRPGARETAPDIAKMASTMGKANGGLASPLQRMPLARSKGVPVAPRAPVVAPPTMPVARGVGVNAKRPGGPDVGALKAAMAKAASQAMPQNAPSMMKKGGKVK